ncbi:TPA: dual specificity protein phosphatase family protein [Burkholderia stabilis]|uniref:dual specificity protein phosphatase family protein n=1 Tax=Burkholderia stabilis TaxID=95485 RepID=UPI00159126AE|nr:dual specificity protein phosphatase family protein [Burkholderia stabilis]HDR9581935.1 dual specificity protein phosphatase family protein [Burkholderia stabilis]HDR9646687.1 dual specificity protein phosphatase family protein [Burkholderia stabilis]HDR9657901.1 dual specificity protein phosphatase family protein [Burkholderia stabilis]HDR9677771.1 dual specificity protein phosphatase family protein [Burkholderia stabilis]
MKIAFVAAIAVTLAGLVQPACADTVSGVSARPVQWAQSIVDARVNNLHRITPTLYRSAQLSREDVPELQKLGIRKVISFRAFHADDTVLAGTHITMQRIRINTWYIRDEDMVTALKALRTADQDGPVLIHCQHGADRTGLVSALYRMVYQGWTREQALDELQHGGYGFHPIWQNITNYLQHVDVERLRREVNSG